MVRKESDRKRTGLRRVPVLVLCTALFLACAKEPPQPPKETATPVTVHKVGQRDLPETLLLPGRVVAKQEVQVSAPLPGRVQEVLVGVGDTVSKGQVMARLETSQQGEEGLQEAREALAAMEAQYARVEQELLPPADGQKEAFRLQQLVKHRVEKLVKATQVQALADPQVLRDAGTELTALQRDWFRLQNQTVSQERLSSAAAPLLQSMQVQIGQARQAVRLAETQLEAGRLTSPIDGVVLAANVSDGAAVAPGLPLFAVGDLSRVEFEILVDPDQQTFLAKGQVAEVQVGDLTPVRTKLASVSPALQPQSKSFTARTPLDNPKRLYKPGMFGRATVTLNPHPNVLAVPKAALLTDKNGRHSVLKIGHPAQTSRTASGADPIPVQTPVELGYDNGTWVEIRKGLTAGDRVVVEGLHLWQPGRPVQIVKTVSGA